MRTLIYLLIFLAVPAFAQDDAPPQIVPMDQLPECTRPITQSPCQHNGRRYGVRPVQSAPPRDSSRSRDSGGRAMTPDEERAYKQWYESGFQGPNPTMPRSERATRTATPFYLNGHYIFGAFVAVMCLWLLFDLRGMQGSVNEIDRINQREKEILAEDWKREEERERLKERRR